MSGERPIGEHVTAFELLRVGGKWLGAVRDRIKWMRCGPGANGERVTWGSNDVIDPPLSIREVEELGAEAAAAALNHSEGRALHHLRQLLVAQPKCDRQCGSPATNRVFVREGAEPQDWCDECVAINDPWGHHTTDLQHVVRRALRALEVDRA